MMCSKKEMNWRRCSLFEVTIKQAIRWDTRERVQKNKHRSQHSGVQARINTTKTIIYFILRAAVFQVHFGDILYLFNGHSASVELVNCHPRQENKTVLVVPTYSQ